jgi:hypothetical protein
MQKRWAAMAVGALMLTTALTGAAFAATSGETDVLQQFRGLRQTHMEQRRQLHEAQGAEMTARVEQAIAEGTITEEQAARLKHSTVKSFMAQKSLMDGRRQKLQMDKGQSMQRRDQMKANLEQFESQRGTMMKGAKRPMLSAMTEEHLQEHLAAAVASGRLTQEQADQMLERHLNWHADKADK